MWPLIKFAHLVSAIVWMGGIAFMLYALRPAIGMLAPPQRLTLMADVLRRFFTIVRVAIAVLAVTGLSMILHIGMSRAPLGWHLMMGIGLLMFAVFGHLDAGPHRRLQRAVVDADWPTAAAQMKRIPLLATINFVLGWIAIAAMRFVA
jgi:uncharacterized membrane protein